MEANRVLRQIRKLTFNCNKTLFCKWQSKRSPSFCFIIIQVSKNLWPHSRTAGCSQKIFTFETHSTNGKTYSFTQRHVELVRFLIQFTMSPAPFAQFQIAEDDHCTHSSSTTILCIILPTDNLKHVTVLSIKNVFFLSSDREWYYLTAR